MRRLCPSLTELQAFEAAARHLSFTRAAETLGVTQGAISRQVRQLEEFLGLELFQRVRKRLVLTEAGAVYFERVRPTLAQLQAATLDIVTYRNGGGTVNLSVTPAFNANWLLPRLSRFSSRHPTVALNFASTLQMDDEFTLAQDAAIRYGDGTWPRTHADYLCGRVVVAVCQPALLRSGRPYRHAADVAKHSLLQGAQPHAWTEWFDRCGASHVNGLGGTRFDNFLVLIHAALSGHGVALVPEFLIEHELRDGRLAVAFERRVEMSTGYWFVCPEEKRDLTPLHAFRAWLLREVAAHVLPNERRRLDETAHAASGVIAFPPPVAGLPLPLAAEPVLPVAEPPACAADGLTVQPPA